MKMIINIPNRRLTFQLFVKNFLFFFILHALSLESYAQSTLCESYPTSFGYEYLADLTINGASKTVASSFNSGADNLGYYDYTDSNLTNLVAGQSYAISFTVKTNSTYNEYVKVWFDFNGNGSLADDGEMVFDQNESFNGTATYTGHITVPSTAYNGDIYIRVMMVYSAVPVLCGSYDYGNTVDLRASISGGVAAQKLTINTSGSGSVISTPSGINTVLGQNSAFFPQGTSVSLAASPDAPQVFVGWSGDVSSTANPLNVNMDADKSITATFELTCQNPTAGGTIASAQSICQGSSPNTLSSTTLPSGHNGTLEYKWQSSTTNATTGFSDIASSNSATYSPGVLNATTWFKRLARVDCETDWIGAVESNVVQINVINGLPSLSYAVSGIQNFPLNTSITPIAINNSGGEVSTGSYSVDPALPSGLSLNGDGSISGTPTISTAPTTYTVTGSNLCGDASTSISISSGTIPTLSNFDDMTTTLFQGSFEITEPNSNSSGAFTYTSSNTAVATISGTTVSILATGTTVITAHQARAGIYTSGNIAATLTVTSVEVLTKYGQNTTSNSNYVNENGAVGSNTAVDRKGRRVPTKEN